MASLKSKSTLKWIAAAGIGYTLIGPVGLLIAGAVWWYMTKA